MATKLVLVALLCIAQLGVVTAFPATASGPKPVRVAVYLVRGEKVVPVGRSVSATRVGRGALVALLRGPSAAERSEGYGTTIPAGTSLRGVTVSGGVATVDVGRRFASGGGSLSMLLRVAQVVHTVTQFSSVSHVRFRLDGRPVKAIGGEGVVVEPPVDRRDFEGQAPVILVERPLAGDVVHGALHVRGTANVFEARLFVDVVSATGRVLAHRSLLATAGTGVRGSFATTIVLPPQQRPVAVVAYARSMKDGARIHVVRVPVRVV